MSVAPLHPYRGAETAFDDVFRRYYSRVRGLARRRFPHLDADEIAQEAMLRLLTHLDRLDPRRDPWAYIATTTVNVGRDMVRAAHPTVALDETAEDRCVTPAADDELLHGELDDRLTDAFRQLPPAGRQVLALHAYDDMSIGQIAEFLGCKENAARQKLFRARRQFVRAFEQLAGATAALVGGFAWFRRSRISRPGPAVVQAGAMTLSSAALIIAAVTALPHGAADVRVDKSTVHSAAMSQPARAMAPAAARRPAVSVHPVVAAAPTAPRELAEATVRSGRLLGSGHTNTVHVNVRTPVGTVHFDDAGQNHGDSAVCALDDHADTDVIDCDD